MKPALPFALTLACACASAPEGPAAGDQPPRPAPPLASVPGSQPEATPSEPGDPDGLGPGGPVPPVPAGGDPAGWVAGEALAFEEILLEWHRTSAREVFLVVEKLVTARLAYAEAERLGLRLDPRRVDAEVQAQIADFKLNVSQTGAGLSPEAFIRQELGVEPQRYWDRIREGTIRQMVAERAVRAWAMENENASVRLIVVRTEEEAQALREELEAGADFADLAREHSVDESAAEGGFLPYLVRQEHSPLARVVFTAEVGEVHGPVPAAGHFFLARLEERRPGIEGGWAALEGPVEASLGTSPVRDAEYLHWKLEVERRYPVDLGPFLRLIGAPGAPSSGEDDRGGGRRP